MIPLSPRLPRAADYRPLPASESVEQPRLDTFAGSSASTRPSQSSVLEPREEKRAQRAPLRTLCHALVSALGSLLRMLREAPRALWNYVAGPTFEECRAEMSALVHDMQNMAWPNRDTLPYYVEVFQAELDLFALRVSEAQDRVEQCRERRDSLRIDARLLQDRLADLSRDTVASWVRQAVDECVTELESVPGTLPDLEDLFRAESKPLIRCLTSLHEAGSLCHTAPALSDAHRTDLDLEIREARDAAYAALASRRQICRDAMCETLWSGLRELQEARPANFLQRRADLRAAVEQSKVLYQRDKQRFCYEIDHNLGRGAI